VHAHENDADAQGGRGDAGCTRHRKQLLQVCVRAAPFVFELRSDNGAAILPVEPCRLSPDFVVQGLYKVQIRRLRTAEGAQGEERGYTR
jgi:hypothetical protein